MANTSDSVLKLINNIVGRYSRRVPWDKFLRLVSHESTLAGDIGFSAQIDPI